MHSVMVYLVCLKDEHSFTVTKYQSLHFMKHWLMYKRKFYFLLISWWKYDFVIQVYNYFGIKSSQLLL